MVARWLYRVLLLAFPVSIRARHGADMAQLFADRCREARSGVSPILGAMRVSGIGCLAVRDAVVHGLGARLAATATIGQDIRYAFRGLRQSPGFTIVALTSLALGIGASTAIFTLLNALVLRPLPVAEPERLVRVASTVNDWDSFTNPMWEALRDREDIFDGVFAVNFAYFEIGERGAAERRPASLVSGAFFATLGLSPAQGRLLDAGDDRRGCPAVAVISHGLWQRRYGGGEVVGTTVLLNGDPFELVGVVAEAFHGVVVEEITDVYIPLCAEAILRGERSNLDAHSTWWLDVVGRLPADTEIASLEGRLDVLSRAVLAESVPPSWSPARQEQFLAGRLELHAGATGYSEVRENYQQALYVLATAVGVVTLVVCVNLANLLLARSTRRRKEIAVRRALGAGAGRLVRQFLTESLLLSCAGAAAGLLLAHWASRALVALITPPEGFVTIDLSLDAMVLGFVAALTIATGAVFGLAPALGALRVDPFGAMRTAGAGGGERRSFLAGGGLVAVQVTLSLVLLTGATLLIGTFWHLETLDPGFDRDNVVLVDVDLRLAGLEPPQLRQAFADLAERLAGIAGVRAASFAELVPIGSSYVTEFVVASDFEVLLDEDAEVYVHRVGPGYFASMGAPVIRGRDIEPSDTVGTEMVAVVSESMARAVFGDTDVLGKTFFRRLNDTDVSEPFLVVGVARDAKYLSLRDEAMPTVYFAQQQMPVRYTGATMTFSVRPEPGAAPLAAIRAVAEQTATGATADTSLLAERLSSSLARERLLAIISAFFGGLALFLAAIGLYGVMTFHVSRRFHEIGVRLALGSSGAGVFARVLAQAARPVAAGLVLGCLGSFAAAGAIESQVFGWSPYDGRALVTAAVVLAAVAMLAAVVPARRAAGTDPAVVLRRDAA